MRPSVNYGSSGSALGNFEKLRRKSVKVPGPQGFGSSVPKPKSSHDGLLSALAKSLGGKIKAI